jgi:2'-hydroxyisoflavone reductase
MKILIIGGTIFLGRHLVEAAQARGHEVTLFNRGKHNPELFPDVEKIRGDRDVETDFAPLMARGFDAVVDTCGYVPRVVSQSARALAGTVQRYCFISSISVYADFTRPGIDETAAVGTLSDPTVEEVTGETYGPLKALCEAAAERELPGRALVIRPGLIVGPHDPTDRFTYWPHRIADGGDILAPDTSDIQTQFIDVRDLAEWNIRMFETGATGVYNATGPAKPLTLGALFETCRIASGSDARFVWIPEAFLKQHDVKPWVELPLWIPESMGEPGHDTISVAKAVAAGLSFRPLSDTVRDTLAWDAGRPQENAWRATLSREKERAVLGAWAAEPK